MATDSKPGDGGGLYRRRIGTPTTDDEVNGYRLFGFGVLLGLAGVAVFLLTESGTAARGIGYALAALAPPFVMLGAVIRFPLRRTGTCLGYLGTAVSALGVVWFVNIFPDGWFTASGDPTAVTVYGVGLLLVGLAGTVVPLLSGPVYEDYDRMRNEAVATTATAEEAGEELAAGGAAFEIDEDAVDEWRWRLRHRNGNVLADSGEGYASRSNAVEAVTSVKADAPGA